MADPQLTSYSTVKKLNAVPLNSELRQGCTLLLLLFNIILRVLAPAIRKDNRKGIKIGKCLKFSLFGDDMLLYIGHPKDTIRKIAKAS